MRWAEAGYRGRWNRGWPDGRGRVHARCPGCLRRHPAACERREPGERRVQGAPRARASRRTVVTTIFGPEWPDAPMRVLKNRAVARAEQGNIPKHPVGETVV